MLVCLVLTPITRNYSGNFILKTRNYSGYYDIVLSTIYPGNCSGNYKFSQELLWHYRYLVMYAL